MALPPEIEKQYLKLREELPQMKKEVANDARILAMARQSPYAAASEDFLELFEMKLKERTDRVELLEMITKNEGKFMGSN